MTPATGHDVRDRLRALTAALDRDRRHDIGYPGATDLAFPELAELMTAHLLNNVGDPYQDGHGRNHTKAMERDVISIIAGWLRAPEGFWGYVTSGASEGTEHVLAEAWRQFPDLVVYASAAAHYSVAKAARRQKLTLVQVAAAPDGRMDVDDLAGELRLRRDRPAVIVATAGTTMTEAIDDIPAIIAACNALAITRRHLHVDAALSGLPLALLPDKQKPAFDFTAGADSIVISGHKFLSTLTPCGVLVHRQAPHLRAGQAAPYIGSFDTTIGGSRSGHTPLLLWLALTRLGVEGHRARADTARNLATYTLEQLTRIGWPAWRHPHAFTVVLDIPPAAVRDKWVLADDGHHAHLITMPGVTREQIDEFLSDLEMSRDVAKTAPVPAQRRRSPLASRRKPAKTPT